MYPDLRRAGLTELAQNTIDERKCQRAIGFDTGAEAQI